jgi:hypothetical protein
MTQCPTFSKSKSSQMNLSNLAALSCFTVLRYPSAPAPALSLSRERVRPRLSLSLNRHSDAPLSSPPPPPLVLFLPYSDEVHVATCLLSRALPCFAAPTPYALTFIFSCVLDLHTSIHATHAHTHAHASGYLSKRDDDDCVPHGVQAPHAVPSLPIVLFQAAGHLAQSLLHATAHRI